MFSARHPRQRRHRLTLGAGGDEDDSVRRHHLRGPDVDQVRVVDPQKAQLPGDAHVAHHRAADERHPPAQRYRGVDDLLHPVDVGGEARHDDAPVGTPDQPVQGWADFAFRRAHAGVFGVRRVAEEQIDAGIAQP